MAIIPLFVVIVILAYFLKQALSFGRRPKGYPPGPPTIPLLGNLHQLSVEGMHLQFHEWAQKYGPVYSLKLGAQTMIVLNKDYAVKELFDRRGQNYSGRPDVFVRHFGNDLNILLRTNDAVWRRQRKMYHLRLNATVADFYVPYQHFESITLLHDIIEANTDSVAAPLKRFTISLASTIIYGWRTTTIDHPLISNMFEWIDGYSKLASKAQIADFFPFLRRIINFIPSQLSWFKREATRLNQLEINTWIPLFNLAKKQHGSETKQPSFCRDMIELKDKSNLTELEMAFNAGHGFAGATDTTLNTLLAFVKAMVLYPDACHKAQAEIDGVVGSRRLPTWDDFDNLRYTRCIMKETLRWHPTTLTGGMPHCNKEEDEYLGYKIPAGAAIINNVWSINNDPHRAIDPRRFNPDRYQNDDTTIGESAALSDPSQRDNYTFGAGRRICPGLRVAERSLFITMSSMLWAFNFEHAIGDDGHEISIRPDALTPGFVAAPQPYKCRIYARDSERARIIKAENEKLKEFLDADGNYNEKFYARFSNVA